VGKKEIQVTFETITPIWTGDINGECTKLKPASIIGSLRFWFEVYCHFSGIEVKEKEDLKYKTFEKIRKEAFEKYNKKEIVDIEEYIIKKLPLTASSKIFGCTGWKSRIEIENIEYLEDYCFGNKLNLPYAIYLDKNKEKNCHIKEFKEKKDWNRFINKCDGKTFKVKLENAKKNYTFLFFVNPYFFGKFSITFKVSNEISENILLPLLKLIEKYGFIGAKNNIGYGRVKIVESIKRDRINLECVGIKKEISNKIFQEKKLPSNLNKLKYNIIEIFQLEENNNVNDCIKNLLSKKAELRRFESNKFIRHYKFGSIAKDIYKNQKYKLEIKGPNATKIIPLISFDESNNTYNCQFLSVWGIQNFGAKNE